MQAVATSIREGFVTRIRTSVLWLAAIFVVFTSALGYAQVGEDEKTKDKPNKTVERADDADDADEAKDEEGGEGESEEAKDPSERKKNHGFYVSQAAHCEDVDDPDPSESPDFTAPEDCDGAGHGKYVSSVAKTSLGKKPKKD